MSKCTEQRSLGRGKRIKMWIIFNHKCPYDIVTALPDSSICVFTLVKHVIDVMDINSYFGVTQMMQIYICDLFFQYSTKKLRGCCGFCSMEMDWAINPCWTDMGLFTGHCPVGSTETLLRALLVWCCPGMCGMLQTGALPSDPPCRDGFGTDRRQWCWRSWIHQPPQEICASKSQLQA